MDRTFRLILNWFIFGFFNLVRVYGNAEDEPIIKFRMCKTVDALNALKTQLQDPFNVLQSWNTTQVNPCMWFHITCDAGDTVVRIDLGNAGLSGQLVPQLGQLTNLQYLELFANNITGRIPKELGNLTNLVGLDLYLNRLEGSIPDTLGNLQKLRFLRLGNNRLTGTIPNSLTNIASLQVLVLSNNFLTGTVPSNGSFSQFTFISFVNNPNLNLVDPVQAPPTLQPDSQSPSVGYNDIKAIAEGAAVGVALVFAGRTIALVWWGCRKQQDHFTDVPAEEDP